MPPEKQFLTGVVKKRVNLRLVYRKYFFVFVFLIIISYNALSQIQNHDTLESTRVSHSKTTSDSAPSPEYNIYQGKEKSDNFYDTLSQKAQNNNWSKHLYNLVTKDPVSNDTIVEESDRSEHFATYEDKIIRNIEIKRLDVFGPSLKDTSRTAQSWLGRTGNSLNIITNKKFIENNIFFGEGEKLDPYMIADNERILRSLPGIQDVVIYVTPVADSKSSVDILIVTKDVFPYGFSWEIYDIGYGDVNVWNTNMLGLGHRLSYTAHYNLNREPKYGYDIAYKMNNIGTSLTSLELKHVNKPDLVTSKIELTRDFITPIMRFGGGLSLGKQRKEFSLETLDTIIEDQISDYSYYDFWFGYSFPLNNFRNPRIRKAYFIATRLAKYHFYERPEPDKNYLYDFYNRNTYLLSAGITWQGYQTTNLVYGFGKTEDIPYGAMIKLTGGYEKHEYGERLYSGISLAYSFFNTKFGFLSNTIDIGGFNKDGLEQGTIEHQLLYFTPLIGNTRHNLRNFLNLTYIHGLNRFDDEYIVIEDEDRIRGLNNYSFKGNHRFFASNELVYYSPQYLYGFRFVYFAFVDAAITNNIYNNSLSKNPLYMSTGIGVRIRNERLVFNTIQFQLMYFPSAPNIAAEDMEYVRLSSYPNYKVPELANRKPEVINVYTTQY